MAEDCEGKEAVCTLSGSSAGMLMAEKDLTFKMASRSSNFSITYFTHTLPDFKGCGLFFLLFFLI